MFHSASGLKVSSRRLKQLVSLKTLTVANAEADAEMEDEENDEKLGIFPDYSPILTEFEDMIVWKQHNGKKIPEPKRGVDKEFDNINETVADIKRQM